MDADEETPSGSALESLKYFFLGDDEIYRREFYFSETSHSLKLLRELNQQRRDGTLCDVILVVDNQDFPCHRNVLAASSQYFRAMFTGEMRESKEYRIAIDGIGADIMRQLIDYTYTADIVITADNAQQLLSAANMVQLHAIQQACCHFLEDQMDATNCLGIHCFAEAHVCSTLSEKAKLYTLQNFKKVSESDELLLLPVEKITEFVSSADLNIDSEEVVLQAVINWVKHDLEQRLPYLAQVLEHVKLPLVDPYFLFDKVDSEPILLSSPESRALIDEAKKVFILKDRVNELVSPRSRPRNSQKVTRLLVTIGGEIYNKNYLHNVDGYYLNENKWMRLKDLPFPRCHHGTAVIDGVHVYAAGGFNKEKVVLKNVLRYEPNLDKWIKVAPMNTPRARHGMATLDGYVYAVGGYDGQSRIDTVERYSPATNKWKFVASIHLPLSRCNATSLSGYLYVAGGTTEPNNQCVDIVQRYDPRTDKWELMCPTPQPRCLGGLVAVRGLVYAVGGTEEMVRACRKLTVYNPLSNKWTELSRMIEGRFDAGVATMGDKIYVLSGHDGENSFFHNIEEYNIATDTWTLLSSTIMPYGRCRFGCTALSIPNK